MTNNKCIIIIESLYFITQYTIRNATFAKEKKGVFELYKAGLDPDSPIYIFL